jgi:hypothetical protein
MFSRNDATMQPKPPVKVVKVRSLEHYVNSIINSDGFIDFINEYTGGEVEYKVVDQRVVRSWRHVADKMSFTDFVNSDHFKLFMGSQVIVQEDPDIAGGKSKRKPLDKCTLAELKQKARDIIAKHAAKGKKCEYLKGFSSMSKEELKAALRRKK